MSRRVIAIVLPACLVAVALLGGCSDDDPPTGPDTGFSLTVTVTEDDGSPAAGVRVAGMPVLAGWTAPAEPPLEGSDGPWHRVRVGFDMLEAGFADVTVHDVTGDEVRALFAEPVPAGFYLAEWDGRDDDGQPLPGGWYDVRVVLTWTTGGGQSLDNPIMLEVCDPDWHALGTTGADGRLVIDDRRLVPALYDPEPIAGMEFTTETLLRLENEYGDGQYVTFDAADAAIAVAAEWAPEYESFRFEILVVDQAGDPVANAAVGCTPGLPEWAWPWSPNGEPTRSRVAIPFELDGPGRVRVHIQDVTGAVVRDIDLGECAAGSHIIDWNGRDTVGDHTQGGWYEIVLLTSPIGGEPVWAAVDSSGVVQAAFDPGQASLGVTDAAGRLVVTDRRVVPAFWDLPTTIFRDENGAELGAYDLTTVTWLACEGPVDGWAWAVVDAVDGAQSVPVTLDEERKPRDKSNTRGTALRGDGPAVAEPAARLLGPYPNPFN